jgi:hypothetical protein
MVGVVLLPVGEVPDVAGVLQERRPARPTLHHRVIDSDREEDRSPFLLPLLSKGGLHLLLHPLAADGWFGQYQQEFVVKVN